MDGSNKQKIRHISRENPDRLGKYGPSDQRKSRNQPRGRQYMSKSKKMVPKVQLILEQAKQQLAQPFPDPDFLMLTCFAEMSEHQKSSLTQEWKNHLAAHMVNLPRLRQEIEAQSIGKQQQNANGCYQEQNRWMEANTRDIQLEIAAISNTFELQCRQMRSMYLRILQTRDFIQY